MVGNASCKRRTNKTKHYTTDNNSAELKKQIFSDNIKKNLLFDVPLAESEDDI